MIIFSEENVRYFIKVFEVCILLEKIFFFFKILWIFNVWGLNLVWVDGVGDFFWEFYLGVKICFVEGNFLLLKLVRLICIYYYLEY